jgi:3',5'-cyclic AMP phosphodiesterase CpdA
MTTRRTFIKQIALSLPLLTINPHWPAGRRGTLRFGWVTDVHHADTPPKWNRHFHLAIPKLNEAVAFFNKQDLDFAIVTGDFIDCPLPPDETPALAYLKKAEETFSGFKGPRYHVMGNHDLDILSKAQYQATIQNDGIANSDTYYSFVKNGYLIIVLDACFTKNGQPYQKGNFKWHDANIPPQQLTWLKETLQKHKLPTLIFTHQLLDGKGKFHINNAAKVRKILESSGQVVAVFQGHKHEGGYQLIRNIHYVTQKALVDGNSIEENSYSVVDVHTSGIEVFGYRQATNHKLQNLMALA